MSDSTCNVWGCHRPVLNHKYSKYCKRHREKNQHNGHPTFTPPALAKSNSTYNQELTMAFHGGRRWYEQADLERFELSFGRLLDEAEELPALSQYRRLGDLPYRKQLLYLLKAMTERIGRHETMKQWLCLYLAADFKKDLFPNRKTFAVFVCRKSLIGRATLPEHITKSGKRKRYHLNAKRALKMLEILQPVFDLAFAIPNNIALWFRCYSQCLNRSNTSKLRMQRYHESNPDYARSLTRKRTLKSINQQYLGGLSL